VRTPLRWIEHEAPGRLATRPLPTPEDLASWRDAGADLVVSLLEPAEAAGWGWADEEERCAAAGLEFLSHPVRDHSVPSDEPAFDALARDLAERIGRGASVIAHCLGGIGRSGLLAGAVLVARGHPLEQALALVGDARGIPAPETHEQLSWLEGAVLRLR
jgi:protein-tyrosine phosphatase